MNKIDQCRLGNKLLKRLANYSLMMIIVSCLTGCTLLRPPQTINSANFILATPSDAHVPGKPSSATIMVSLPTATPGYQNNKMIYTQQRYNLQSFSLHQWIAPPANLLQPLLIESLQSSGHFRAVVAAPFAGVTDYRLDTHLLQLEQIFTATGSRVVVVIRAVLVNNAEGRIVASQRFSSVVMAAPSPYGGVIAANQATRNILQAIVYFCARSIH